MKKILYIILVMVSFMFAFNLSEVRANESYIGLIQHPQTPNILIPGFADRPCYFVYMVGGPWLALRKDHPYYKEIKEQILLAFVLGRSISFDTETALSDECSNIYEITYSHL